MTLHGKHTLTRLVSTVYLILQTKMSAAADLTTNVTPGQNAPTPPDPTRVAVWVVIQGTGSRVAAENVSAMFQFSCFFLCLCSSMYHIHVWEWLNISWIEKFHSYKRNFLQVFVIALNLWMTIWPVFFMDCNPKYFSFHIK